MEESGKNRTPDKLRKKERGPLFDACDVHLKRVVEHIKPEYLIGIGKFASERAESCFEGAEKVPEIGRILHPSPANPRAAHNWAEKIEKQLGQYGIRIS